MIYAFYIVLVVLSQESYIYVSFILAKFFFSFLNISLSETIDLSLGKFIRAELKQKEYTQHPQIRVSGETGKSLEVKNSTLRKQIYIFYNFRTI